MAKVQIGQVWGWAKALPWVGMVITIGCLALIVLRNLYPSIFKMDAISIGLLIVAVAPWIRSAIKSIEVAGVGKIELNDVEKLARKVEASELPSHEGSNVGDPQDTAESEQSTAEIHADITGGDGREPGTRVEVDEATASASNPLKMVDSAIFQIMPRAIMKPSEALAQLESNTSLIGSDMRTLVQLNATRDIMLRALRNLCQLSDIPHLALSPADMLDGLVRKSAITQKQADGIAAALDMVHEVTLTPATPEAAQRALDVAKDVIESLDVMIRKVETIRLARNRKSHYAFEHRSPER